MTRPPNTEITVDLLEQEAREDSGGRSHHSTLWVKLREDGTFLYERLRSKGKYFTRTVVTRAAAAKFLAHRNDWMKTDRQAVPVEAFENALAGDPKGLAQEAKLKASRELAAQRAEEMRQRAREQEGEDDGTDPIPAG